jgi:hypothetical protein
MLIAEKVMGWERGVRYGNGNGAWRIPDKAWPMTWDQTPAFSSDLAQAWRVVARLQELNPGWRFMLLGGDQSFGYIGGSPKKGIDYERREFFGWHAEFFGHIDPSQNYGDRHASEHADTAPLAICLAALAAIGDPAHVR